MKNLFLSFIAFSLLLSACKKDKSNPGNPNNTNSTNPYFFNFTFNGAAYKLTSDLPQYMSFYPNLLGGYQDASTGLFPSIGLSLNWPVGDTVHESDVTGIIGQTFYFNESAAIVPQLTFDEVNVAIPTWYANDTSNTSYYVKITNVKFLKNDTSLGTPIRTYVITGTCAGVMSQSDSTEVLSGGTFNFIVSRMDL